MLSEAGYDTRDMQYLVEGFSFGFDLCYEGSQQRCDTSANIPFTVGDKVDMLEKIMKEVSMGRYASPFEHIPYDICAITYWISSQGWEQDQIDISFILQFQDRK